MNDGEYYDTIGNLATQLSTAGNENNIEKKVIKNAKLSIQSEDVNDTYTKILDFARENGGYEFSRVSSTSGNYSYIDAVIKLPPQNLDKLMEFADTQGEISRSETTSDDITDTYYDSMTRLNTSRRNLDKYYEFLEESQNVDEMLKIQEKINALIMEIESFEGKLRMWDKLIAESTVTLHISQKLVIEEPLREINWSTLSANDMGYLLKKGFLGVINSLATFLQWMIIFIVSASPFIVIFAIIVVAVYLVRKKRRALGIDNAKDFKLKDE
jgi:hypothetical protein